MSPSLWTLVIRGGTPRTFQLRGNPTVEHDGGQTVHHIVATPVQIRLLRDLIQMQGCELEFLPARQEDSAQRHERAALLGRGMEDVVWPSVGCPGCFWFDPTAPDPCRYRTEKASVLAMSVEAHPKARADVEACPVIRSEGGSSGGFGSV